jgi:mitogen-activated protein kinase kinase kinase 9
LEAALDDKQRALKTKQQELEDKQNELKRIEDELHERAMNLLHRELSVKIQQQAVGVAPTPHKRKGHFKKSRLKLLKKDGSFQSNSIISAPTGNFA